MRLSHHAVKRFSTCLAIRRHPPLLIYEFKPSFSVINAGIRVRYMAQQKGFISGFLENLKEEFSKNKELKENIKKFREEAKKLEDSEALIEARSKYKSFEAETIRGSAYVKEKVGEFAEMVKDSELAKQAANVSEQLSVHARKTAKTISETSEKLGQTETFKVVSSGIHSLKSQIDNVTNISNVNMYSTPKTLRKRSDFIEQSSRCINPNEDATTVVLHHDSSWFQSWQNFKDNNPYMNKIFEFKARYDESDNLIIRATRTVTDKFAEIFGGLFSKTEVSEALTEITKIDPSFEIHKFLKQIQTDIAPNILGALTQHNFEVLRDWCHEAVFNTLSYQIKQAEANALRYNLEIIDLGEIEFAAAKLMEQGPVIVVTFLTQQISYLTDAMSRIVQGDPNKLTRVMHIWALCRDQSILDPNACWRLIDMSMHERGDILI